jgi:hypothetical protein
MHFRPLHDRVVVPHYRSGVPSASGTVSLDPGKAAPIAGSDPRAVPPATARLWTMPRPRRRTARSTAPFQPLSPASTPETPPDGTPG